MTLQTTTITEVNANYDKIAQMAKKGPVIVTEANHPKQVILDVNQLNNFQELKKIVKELEQKLSSKTIKDDDPFLFKKLSRPLNLPSPLTREFIYED